MVVLYCTTAPTAAVNGPPMLALYDCEVLAGCCSWWCQITSQRVCTVVFVVSIGCCRLQAAVHAG
jgi:hypothetical protein